MRGTANAAVVALVAAVVGALSVNLATSALAPAAAGPPQAERKHLRGTAKVKIRGFSFRPRKITVARGATVVFANRDRAAHDATRRGSFSTGRLRSGRSAAVRFSRRGAYRYLCTIHPFMRGKVVVR
jgi:plastocyanin